MQLKTIIIFGVCDENKTNDQGPQLLSPVLQAFLYFEIVNKSPV